MSEREEITMFGSNGLGMFGTGMKSARVADQIDAQVNSGRLTIQNANMAVQQLDYIESQLTQMASMLQQEVPMIAMQFQNLVQQINNNQGQVVNALKQADTIFASIDQLTDKIQN
ncbi:hypothetical protein [Bacillus gaemokensis]|nr:hypothetical protein [Bacillus gaemokensis]